MTLFFSFRSCLNDLVVPTVPIQNLFTPVGIIALNHCAKNDITWASTYCIIVSRQHRPGAEKIEAKGVLSSGKKGLLEYKSLQN